MKKIHKIFFMLAILVLAGFGCNGPAKNINQDNNSTKASNTMSTPGLTGETDDRVILEGENGDIKIFDMEAKRFEFIPSTIKVNQGDFVIINLTSTDVDHGIIIPEFGVDVDAPAGETVKVEFKADKKGEYVFRCSVFCGSGHGDMVGTLIVE